MNHGRSLLVTQYPTSELVTDQLAPVAVLLLKSLSQPLNKISLVLEFLVQAQVSQASSNT